MISLREMLDLYDNWNGRTVINGSVLNRIVDGRTSDIVALDDTAYLLDLTVIAFGFYDDEFCVRVDDSGCTKYLGSV